MCVPLLTLEYVIFGTLNFCFHLRPYPRNVLAASFYPLLVVGLVTQYFVSTIDGMNSFFSLCELVVLQILLSVNENLTLCKTIAKKRNTQEMSFVFTAFCFMATFCGSILLALLEKMQRGENVGFNKKG